MEIFGETHDYRKWLKAEFKRRQSINAKYSLRGFAKTLSVSPSFLSKVLSGKKNLSLVTAVQIADRLNFTKNEKSQFCRWVQSQLSPDSAKAALQGELAPGTVIGQIDLDVFQTIADWHHYALRELVATRGFKADPAWISRRLGIGEQEAEEAFARLARLQLIRKEGRKWVQTSELLTTKNQGTPSAALRHHHSQMIQKARESLETQNLLERDISGITVPTNPEKVEAVRAEIKAFRRKMARLMETSTPGEVYQLNIQLFKLTNKVSGKVSSNA